METLENRDLKVKNFRCFVGEDPQGFDCIRPINLVIGKNNSGKSALLDAIEYSFGPKSTGQKEKTLQLFHAKNDLLFKRTFKRLYAERDIVPERPGGPVVGPPGLLLGAKGDGATACMQELLHGVRNMNTELEETLVTGLNYILEPDAHIIKLSVRTVENGLLEIFLKEKNKGEIRLSHQGSGLKTVILVLCFLHLVPFVEKKGPGAYVYAFEELENNLHPSLHRRLLAYIRKHVVEYDSIFFITTHSSVAIDFFGYDEKAQIVHITHENGVSKVSPVSTYPQKVNILDDLDVRASDILQSNGIIWVEGPSDRLYVNRWIDLWTDGVLKEGTHYQCIFYGGRLLSHLSASSPDQEETIQVLKVNRNAAFLIDSDKESSNDNINNTKERIVKEMTDMGGMAWVTHGREIENYLSQEVFQALYPEKEILGMDSFAQMSDYLDGIQEGAGKKFEHSKVDFAARACPYITKAAIERMTDLKEKVEELCNHIRKWNNQEVTPPPHEADDDV